MPMPSSQLTLGASNGPCCSTPGPPPPPLAVAVLPSSALPIRIRMPESSPMMPLLLCSVLLLLLVLLLMLLLLLWSSWRDDLRLLLSPDE